MQLPKLLTKHSLLVLVCCAVVTSACGLGSGRADIRDVTLSAPNRLAVGVDTCNADLSPVVEESETEVRIEVNYENATDDGCGDVIFVELENPLGARTVFDVAASEVVQVIGR